jgi:hypothetical protein
MTTGGRTVLGNFFHHAVELYIKMALGGHPKPAINGHLKTGHYG